MINEANLIKLTSASTILSGLVNTNPEVSDAELVERAVRLAEQLYDKLMK